MLQFRTVFSTLFRGSSCFSHMHMGIYFLWGWRDFSSTLYAKKKTSNGSGRVFFFFAEGAWLFFEAVNLWRFFGFAHFSSSEKRVQKKFGKMDFGPEANVGKRRKFYECKLFGISRTKISCRRRISKKSFANPLLPLFFNFSSEQKWAKKMQDIFKFLKSSEKPVARA